MELFIDSADMDVIRKATDLGFVEGITTTPTFMQRQGITDVDGAIVELSTLAPQLHVEALGDDVGEIVDEAKRIAALEGLQEDIVFKIPVNMVGLQAVSRLTDQGYKVNVHLVYTLNQAYMAAEAGATYVCPLVGRLHDQGHDSFALIENCVEMIEDHDYPTKVLVSSVRHPEHVRQAVISGAQAVTIPWKVMKILPENALTGRGIRSFSIDTHLTTDPVHEFVRDATPGVSACSSVAEAAIEMTNSGFGIVSVVDDDGQLLGVVTDGDLRRSVDREDLAEQPVSELMSRNPRTIQEDTVLQEGVDRLRDTKVDNLVVVDADNSPVGVLDVQHLLQEGLMG